MLKATNVAEEEALAVTGAKEMTTKDAVTDMTLRTRMKNVFTVISRTISGSIVDLICVTKLKKDRGMPDMLYPRI